LFAKILHQLNLEWEFLEDGADPYKP
jgi:hypothetical protein